MSVWTTKSLNKDCDYIVLQHSIKGSNTTVNGVKFRNGYAVVEKNSKTYLTLKKMPFLNNAKEFPLIFLKKLSFITRSLDIQTVYGKDVYLKFIEAEKNIEEEKSLAEINEKKENRNKEFVLKQELEQKLEEAKKEGNLVEIEELEEKVSELKSCCYKLEDGTFCRQVALSYSPNSYCFNHLYEDPKLEELGITKPRYLTKDEKKKYNNKVKNILEKEKKAGKF